MSVSNFWKNKKVFLTGHTGFKGGWASMWLKKLECNVAGFSLDPLTTPSLFQEADITLDAKTIIGDIRNYDLVYEKIQSFAPEIVIHMAAQPLVRESYNNPLETYSINVMGTANILEACRNIKSVRAIVNVTTDKCYENKEWEWPYRENEPMGGHDPYSSSKGCSELLSNSYARSFFNEKDIFLATARAGNVIGGGDWSKDRLVPDALKAFQNKQQAIIRNPQATRPWQHVLEPIAGYLSLAEKLYTYGNDYTGAWNFGPSESGVATVSDVLEKLSKKWGEDASWSLEKGSQPHEAKNLMLDISKARTRLGWEPLWNLDKAIEEIVIWHKTWLNNPNQIKDLCIQQIDSYENLMQR